MNVINGFWPLYLLLTPWVLWVIYAAVMNFKRVREVGKLTTAQTVLGYPWLFLGLFLDFVVNVFIATPLFLELPHELTVSSRLWRLSNGEAGHRQRVALWLRTQLLDSLDPSGVHSG